MSDDVVDEVALRAPDDACPLCGARGERRRTLRLQTSPDVWLRRCPRCHAQSAERLPTDDHLHALYDPAHYSSSLVSASSLTSRLATRLARDLAPALKDRAPHIVDYGGSTGALSRALLDALQTRGVPRGRATVVDLFVHDDDDTVRFLTPDAYFSADDDDGRADVVLASAVLEHLIDPGDVLRSLFRRARGDAFFYARTPWDVPLARRVPGYRVRWPRHLHDLDADFWDRAPNALGLGDVDVIRSRPSIVETTLRDGGARALAAHLLKLPGRAQARLTPSLRPRWPWVGGWEVLWRRRDGGAR